MEENPYQATKTVGPAPQGPRRIRWLVVALTGLIIFLPALFALMLAQVIFGIGMAVASVGGMVGVVSLERLRCRPGISPSADFALTWVVPLVVVGAALVMAILLAAMSNT